MPNWQPNWSNVRWDWGASDAAASALYHAANKLEGFTYERTNVAAEAQQQWRGRYRDEFDVELRQLRERSAELAWQMREAASRIRREADHARDEQRHRERERERWHREKREEEERERRRNQH